MKAPIAPAAAAKEVVTNTNDTSKGLADNTEPPLNPNHPNHNKNTPIAAKGIECPVIGLIPFAVYFPALGPKK